MRISRKSKSKQATGGDKTPLTPIARKRLANSASEMLKGLGIDADLGEELPKNLKPHPLSKLFPPFTDEEFEDLVEDLRVNGQQMPIALFDGRVLNGWHRYRGCLKAGVRPRGKPYTGLNPATFVCSANFYRRHLVLTTAEKRELIARVLKESPELSNLQVSKITKTSDKTVASERTELESRSEIPNVETRTDTKGRKQPATKASKSKPKGEVIGHIPGIGPLVMLDPENSTEPSPPAGDRRALNAVVNGQAAPNVTERAVEHLVGLLWCINHHADQEKVCDLLRDHLDPEPIERLFGWLDALHPRVSS